MEFKGLFMRYRFPSFFVFILLIGVGWMAYLLGKKNASKTIDNIVLNNVFVKQIAELSTLEVRGNTSIKSTNLANDGSFSDAFKKLFLEKTFNISYPYVAKYGIDLSKQQINIEEKNKQVYIVLPEPVLLSYELVLNKGTMNSSKGLFETDNETFYGELQQKLYTQSKAQLEKNNSYKEKTKEKIKKVISEYYASLNLKVEISFTDDLKSRIINKPLL